MRDAATITRAEHDAAVAERDAKIAEDAAKIARLEERVAKLQHALWGRRSEKPAAGCCTSRVFAPSAEPKQPSPCPN